MNILLVMLNTSVRYIFEDLFKALIWLGFFAAIFFAYYFYMKARNQERMAMIEKGNDLSELYKAKPKRATNFPWYKLIFTILGVAFGALTAFLFIEYVGFNHVEPGIFIIVMMLIIGALGMLIGHRFDMKKTIKSEDTK